ncbi:MAG TPA: hypothetical protein VF450_16015 [Noviherbaspirillum sp.]
MNALRRGGIMRLPGQTTLMQTIALFSMMPVEACLPDGKRLKLPWRS